MHDAVIALANQMDAAGRLNEESMSRLTLACDLVKSGRAPLLVTCGWDYRDDSDLVIADVMAEWAMRHLGMDASHILTEPQSRDTVGDAVFTKRSLANRFGWNSILVVTSAYHVERTKEIFAFVYGRPVDVRGAPGPDDTALAMSEARFLAAFRSTFAGVAPGDDEAIYTRLRTAHPFYNGEVYPALAELAG